MNTQLLERLAEIARLEPQKLDAAEILDLMEQYAEGPQRLKTLVEKYGHSTVPIIARTVSYLLAKASESPTQETYDAVFLMIERLRCKEDEGTLENCLTALGNLIEAPSFEQAFSQPHARLHSFLMHCLNGAVIVQHGALQVISLLYFNGLLFDVFTPSQINSIRMRLVEFAGRHEELLDLELEALSPLVLDLHSREAIRNENAGPAQLYEVSPAGYTTIAATGVQRYTWFAGKDESINEYTRPDTVA